MKTENGRNPLQFNFTVTVVTSRDYVVCVPDMVVTPKDWSNIVYSTGEWFPPNNHEFICERGETKTISITITPPFNQLNDTYDFVLMVYIEDNVEAYDEAAFSIVIRQKAGFELVQWDPPPGVVFNAIPPASTTIRFALYNTGNGRDQFLVQGGIYPPDSGWTLEFVSGVDEANLTPELPPDMWKENPHFIDVKVRMPEDVRAGVTVQVSLTIVSMFNVSLNKTMMFASVTSLQRYGFEAYVKGPDKRDGKPGEEVEFLIVITNTGNGWDVFGIKPIWDVELNPDFIASTDPRVVEIDASAKTTVR